MGEVSRPNSAIVPLPGGGGGGGVESHVYNSQDLHNHSGHVGPP